MSKTQIPRNLINIIQAHFLYEFFCQSQNVTRKKLPKQCLYKKFVSKTLIKLTPAIHFINIQCTIFSYEGCFGSFFMYNVTRKKLPKRNVCMKNAHAKLWWNWQLDEILNYLLFFSVFNSCSVNDFNNRRWIPMRFSMM
jgi:hypothetical protein